MVTTITAVILALTAGILIGFLIGGGLSESAKDQIEDALDLNDDGKLNAKDAQLALDLNKDGKIDEKDLDKAKKELKKVAAQTTKLVNKVK